MNVIEIRRCSKCKNKGKINIRMNCSDKDLFEKDDSLNKINKLK